jgi:hypothetical protein
VPVTRSLWYAKQLVFRADFGWVGRYCKERL